MTRNLADNFPQDRLFGDEPKLPSTRIPGASEEERDANRAQFQRDALVSPGQVSNALQLDQMQELLAVLRNGGSPAQALKNLRNLLGMNAIHGEDITDALLRLIRRTNITASQPAHSAPTLWSQPLDLSATVSIPAAVGTWVNVLNYTVPPGYAARIATYGVDVDSGYTYQGSLLWRLSVNGLNVPMLSGWGEHRGSLANPRQTYFVAQEDQRIAFDVIRATAGGGTNVVQMAMQGWVWRKRMNFEGTKSSVTAY